MNSRKILFLFLNLLATSSIAQTLTIQDEEGNGIPAVTIRSLDTVIISSQMGQCDISAFINADTIEIFTYGYSKAITSFSSLQKNNFVLKMKYGSIEMPKVVLSANKWEQKKDKTPFSIHSLDKKQRELQNPQTTADLLSSSGKVMIQKSQQGGGSPMIRGFSANRLLYSVDGVRMNNAIFRSGNLHNVISLDPFTIETTEVLFGPGSVVYGSDAIGGVMSFQTLQAQLAQDTTFLFTGNGVLRYSSANQEQTAHFDFNVGTKKWAFLTSITSTDYGDLKMGKHGPDEFLRPQYVTRINNRDTVLDNNSPRLQNPSGYSQINFMQKIRYAPKDSLSITYGFHYSETSSFGRYDRHNRMKNNYPRYGEWDYGPQKWVMNNLSVQNKKKHLLFNKYIVRIAHQFFEESRINRGFNDDTRYTNTEQVNAFSLNADFLKKYKKHTFYYGSEVVVNDVNSKGISQNIDNRRVSKSVSRYPNARWNSVAGYLVEEYAVTDSFSIHAGVRYNYFNLKAVFDTSLFSLPFLETKNANSSVTGNLGIVYYPSSTWLFSTNLSTGFRAPNIDDIGKIFDSEPGAVVVPNPNLKAEYAYNAELSITKNIKKKVQINITGFYTLLTNTLVRDDYTFEGKDFIIYQDTLSRIQAIQNLERTHVYGLQSELKIKLSKRFLFSSQINIQEGENVQKNGKLTPSRHSAPWFGQSTLQYKRPKIIISLYSQYSGGKTHEKLALNERNKVEIYGIDKDGNTYVPSWYTINLKASYQFKRFLIFNLGLENITNQLYRTYSSGLASAGRNLVISAKASF